MLKLVLLNKLNDYKKAKQLLSLFALSNILFYVLCGTLCAQNKVGIKKCSLLSNTGGGGVSIVNNKLVYSETGNVISNGNKPYNIHYLMNANLDTIQTATYNISTHISSNYLGFTPFKNNKNELFYSGFADNLSSINDVHIIAKANSNFNITNYKAYKSKNICYSGVIKQFINDSVFILSKEFKYASSFTQNNFSLWWLNKNLDTINQKIYINNKNCGVSNCFSVSKKELLVFGGNDSIDKLDAYVMRLDSAGGVKWAKSIGTNGQDGFNSLKIRNSYYLVGNTNLPTFWDSTYSEITLAKIDTGGNVLKTYKIATDHVIWNRYAFVSGNSILLPCESFTTTGSAERKGLFLKIDTNGVVQKQYIIGQAHNGFINFLPLSLCTDSLKNIYCSFWRWNLNSDPFYSGLIKLDSNLVGCYPSEPAFNFTTTVAPPGFLHVLPMHFRVAKDSIYEVFGTINQGHGFNTIIDECVGYVGIKEEGSLQNEYFKIYPNPAQDIITIESTAYINEPYSIAITNSLGEVVLAPLSFGEGLGVRSLNISTLPTGIYFINLYNKQKSIYKTKISVVR